MVTSSIPESPEVSRVVHGLTLTRTGQPRLGAVFELPTDQGEMGRLKIVGKLFGRGGNRDLVGIIVEDLEMGYRFDLKWPLTHHPPSTKEAE